MDNYRFLKKSLITVLFFIAAFPMLSTAKAWAANVFAGVGNDGYFHDVQGLYAALRNVPDWSGIKDDYLHENLSGTEIKDSITGLQTILQPDDTLIWFYSGHGGTVADANGDETAFGSFAADGVDETVGLVRQTDQLSDDDLSRTFLSLTQATGSRVITIFDTCYAGGFIGGTSDLSSVPGLVFFGSSTEVENSYAFKDQPYSIFTQGLINGLENLQADFDKNGELLAGEWFDFAADYTLGLVEKQHPVFRDNENVTVSKQSPVPLPASFWFPVFGVASLIMVRRTGQSL